MNEFENRGRIKKKFSEQTRVEVCDDSGEGAGNLRGLAVTYFIVITAKRSIKNVNTFR